MPRYLTVTLVHGGIVFLVRPAMDSSEDDTSVSDGESLHVPEVNSWDARPWSCINNYPVSL